MYKTVLISFLARPERRWRLQPRGQSTEEHLPPRQLLLAWKGPYPVPLHHRASRARPRAGENSTGACKDVATPQTCSPGRAGPLLPIHHRSTPRAAGSTPSVPAGCREGTTLPPPPLLVLPAWALKLMEDTDGKERHEARRCPGGQRGAQQGRERRFPASPTTSQAPGVQRALINPGSRRSTEAGQESDSHFALVQEFNAAGAEESRGAAGTSVCRAGQHRACREPAAKPSLPRHRQSPPPKKRQFGACWGMKIQAVPPACDCRGSPRLPPAPARRGRRAERAPRTAMSSSEERETLLTGSCRTQPAAGPPLAATWGQTDRQTDGHARGWGGVGGGGQGNLPQPELPRCRRDLWL
ncbi:uncharacterized protein LOC116793571 [Chiroxiphia lanceolata]|uniref:uncharacterized protein LOC116793571 n=1 Tax=Chiroxiphia lanceolata TaxID=296741 RepID=UPI0013CEEB2A|nr:uncharacterized protein LOC116793571 [Chiroxiphia lanceolata]